jgi:Ni2+-binding GTPase involved in maturation of urease and hydrogenase
VTRRLMWLGVGAVAGSGATVWVRRRVDRLQQRMKPAQVAGGVVTMMDHGARSTAGRVRDSVDSGRHAAHRRAHELRRDLEGRDQLR